MATVLVVDDDPASREFLRTLLSYRGHQTCEAPDGDSALMLADQLPPDAVITDVMMPGLDGYELVRMLRSRPATSHIPIAFSTAHYGQQEIRPLAEACGVQDIIFKPAHPADVLATIDALLADLVLGRGTGGRTAHRRAERIDRGELLERAAAIRLGEGRLHAIATTAPVGVLLADGAGSAYYVNARLTHILGQPEAALLGKGWLDRIEAVGRERLLAAMASGAIRDGRPHRVATTAVDSETRWLDICLYPISDAPADGDGQRGTAGGDGQRGTAGGDGQRGTAGGDGQRGTAGDIIGIIEDLDAIAQGRQSPPAVDEWATRLRRHAAHLADRLAETHDLTQSGTWDLDLDTDMVVLSPRLQDLLRLPSAAVPRAELRQLVHPEDLARITAMAESSAAYAESPNIAELRVADADGAIHELIVSYRMAVPDGRSTRPAVWGVAQDVTHIRTAQRAQLQAQAAWQAERRVVHSVHRAMLPTVLPTVAGVDLGASYLAAPDRLDIGAGWYDALAIPGGGVLLSVGRVAGYEQHAAAVGGPVRAVLRAYGAEDADPIGILSRLNRFLTDTYDDDTFVTAVVARYEPDTGRLRLANAGHPAPVVIAPDPDGAVALGIPPRGPALGIHGDAEFAGLQMIMPAGGGLCVYTGGLSDRPGGPVPADVERLPSVAARAFSRLVGGHGYRRPGAQYLANLIVRDMLDGNAPDDDICVAVLWAIPEDL